MPPCVPLLRLRIVHYLSWLTVRSTCLHGVCRSTEHQSCSSRRADRKILPHLQWCHGLAAESQRTCAHVRMGSALSQRREQSMDNKLEFSEDFLQILAFLTFPLVSPDFPSKIHSVDNIPPTLSLLYSYALPSETLLVFLLCLRVFLFFFFFQEDHLFVPFSLT